MIVTSSLPVSHLRSFLTRLGVTDYLQLHTHNWFVCGMCMCVGGWVSENGDGQPEKLNLPPIQNNDFSET